MIYAIGIVALIVTAIAYYLIGRTDGRKECDNIVKSLDIFYDGWADDNDTYYSDWKKSNR